MSRRHHAAHLSLVAVLALAFAVMLLPQLAHAQPISMTATAGKYSVNLKVLPAEAFMDSHQTMVRSGGAMAAAMNGPAHPNHHMVVFIKENGKPVEHAHVTIRYRMASGMGKWMTLPVTSMYVKGAGVATTHFGNNVMLKSGSYEVRVQVNHELATFHFTL